MEMYYLSADYHCKQPCWNCGDMIDKCVEIKLIAGFFFWNEEQSCYVCLHFQKKNVRKSTINSLKCYVLINDLKILIIKPLYM